jgi:hypothetical protein
VSTEVQIFSLCGTGWREFVEMICPTGETKYFCKGDWTGFGVICPSGGFVESAQQFCLSRRLFSAKISCA